jgi:phosphoglycerate kinase
MAKKTVNDLTNLQGKRVLMRVDFNVPVDAAGKITNDRRIRAAVPTIRKVLEAGAAVIVMSHLGRPKGNPVRDAPLRMDHVAALLGKHLSVPVKKVDAVVGAEVEAAARCLVPGEVLMLENLRFHPGEQKGDPGFAKQIAALADVYVNDAFGTCHRSDASMAAVHAAMAGKPRVVGLLVARELQILDELLSAPQRPFLSILGGAKVSDKIGFIKSLLGRVDRILIGGAMSYTFLAALGRGTGSSKAESDKLEVARELLALGKERIVLPVDHLVVQALDHPESAYIAFGEILPGWIGVDIGPKTIARFREEIGRAATIVWNGPLGKYEDAPYSKGTREIAQALAAARAVTVVGGGETAEAVESFGLDREMTHVSTGGGAFLEYIEGTPFAALGYIDDAKKP